MRSSALAEHEPGVTRRRYLERIKDVSEDASGQLERDQISPAASYLWRWYIQLKSASSTGFDNALTWTVINDWSRLMKVDIQPWEVSALIAADRAYREGVEKYKPKRERDGG